MYNDEVNDLFSKLNITRYFLVGSRAYDGCYHEFKASNDDSDWDYIVEINDVKKIQDEVGLDNIKPSNYNNGFKFKLRYNIEVNIIPCNTVEYNAWMSATKTLYQMARTDALFRKAIADTYTRYALTEQARALHKTGTAVGGFLKRTEEASLIKEVDNENEDILPWRKC